jgi:hypothetical protein
MTGNPHLPRIRQGLGRTLASMNMISRHVGVVAIAAAMVAACSPLIASASPPGSTSTIIAQAVPHGVEAAIGDVPWSEVGPGWMLATWSPVPGRDAGPPPEGEPAPDTAVTTLYLVDPAGGRYGITTFPPPGDGPSPTLVDWSGDGHRALFYSQGYGSSSTSTVIEVDLHTGAQTSFTVDNGSQVRPRYTRPEGKAVLLSTLGYPGQPSSLERLDLAGNHQLTYPVGKDFGGYLSARDGTQLVVGTGSGLALMGNDGTAGKTLPVAGQTDCAPTRWWDAASTIAVASCRNDDKHGSQLWLVPIGGGTPTALTAPNNGQNGPDYADLDAWRLAGGTFVQAAGACGHLFLAKVGADGKTTEVAVPNVDSHKSVVVVGVNGDNLELHATVSCGSGESLFAYNPAAGTSTVLLGAPINRGGVIGAVPYPGQE